MRSLVGTSIFFTVYGDVIQPEKKFGKFLRKIKTKMKNALD